MAIPEPSIKPKNPRFSSGPCNKYPDFDPSQLDLNILGRSHRAEIGKVPLKRACEQTAKLLGLPVGYRVGIVPASDTGAVEMAFWSLLGARGVDVLAWESFGRGWVSDIKTQLKLEDVRVLDADYGLLPDLSQVSFDRDVVFTWNGTTSGVKVPDGNWIDDNRRGLTICDATSAIFAMEMPWQKLDVVTYSWQKVLGGEGAHGMLILGPRAVERLENYTPPWPLPKIFRLTKDGKLIEGIFQGATINTPSMLCVADYLGALDWVERIGGVATTIQKSKGSLEFIAQFVAENDWIHFLAQEPQTRSNTSICLTLDATPEQVKAVVGLLADEHIAYDIGSYRDAPPGIRIWCGATIAPEDVRRLMPWIQWAYQSIVATQ